MLDQYEPVHQHNISNLIEFQFPEFFRENGPVFVEFVKKYYQWLEGSQDISEKSFTGKGQVVVNAKTANVAGIGTAFTSWFANGDSIAIYKEDTSNDYDLLTIETVVDDETLIISANTLPNFSSSNSWYTTVKSQNNPNYHLRRYMETKDVDLTVDEFLVYFKEKYLKNIQFETRSNMRTFLKHALDLYRSKGTERSIDLLFRAVFGVPASVYYPGDDIFRLSDGKWYRPTYLEISIKKDANQLIGKQIVGAISGATAFAEALVRRTIKGRIVDILYISAVKGDFVVDEPLNTSDNLLDVAERPNIIGSLTYIDIDTEGTGANYSIGDFVDIYSDYGEQGKGKVTGIVNATGKVDFELENGGYGYRDTAEVLVSEKIVSVANVEISANNPLKSYIQVFDEMVQPLANIEYDNLTGGQFAVGSLIYSWNAGVNQGIGRVIDAANTSPTAGWLFVSVLTGNLNYSNVYSSGNTVRANVAHFVNATCRANTVGYYANVIFGVKNASGSFIQNEIVYQTDPYGIETANGVLVLYNSTGSGTASIKISNTYGVFKKNNLIKGRISNSSANIQSTTIYVGAFDISNAFYTTTNNYVYFANSESNGTIQTISEGSLANVSFSNSLLYTETVELSNDFIRDYLSVPLNAVSYGFPANSSANLTTCTLDEVFETEAHTVGKIQQLTGINKGSNYSAAPIARIYDSVTVPRYRQDLIVYVTGLDGAFMTGEVVTQTTPNSRGLVKWSNTSCIRLEQLRMLSNNDFVLTSDADTKIVGERSLASANIVQIDIDTRSEYLGYNAIIDTSVQSVEGAVTDLAVISSGFGYIKADSLRFVRSGLDYGHEDAGFGFAELIHQGTGEGYYKRKGGWLSDQTRLFDGIYYQDFSYEIRSSVTLNKYEEMLKQLLHVAGTKYFGALVHKTKTEVNSTFKNAIITSS